jgi:hypothetical protein
MIRYVPFFVVRLQFHIFFKQIQKSKTRYSEEQVISMLEFLFDDIFISFGGTLFQQVVGINNFGAIVSMIESFVNCFF